MFHAKCEVNRFKASNTVIEVIPSILNEMLYVIGRLKFINVKVHCILLIPFFGQLKILYILTVLVSISFTQIKHM